MSRRSTEIQKYKLNPKICQHNRLYNLEFDISNELDLEHDLQTDK